MGEMAEKNSKIIENLEFNVGKKKGKHFLRPWLNFVSPHDTGIN